MNGAPVSSIDLLPTIAAAAGAKAPNDRPIDGVDLLPHLAAGGAALAPRPLFWRDGAYRSVIDDGWKLIVSARPARRWLFDLGADPTERNDLSAREPPEEPLVRRRSQAKREGAVAAEEGRRPEAQGRASVVARSGSRREKKALGLTLSERLEQDRLRPLCRRERHLPGQAMAAVIGRARARSDVHDLEELALVGGGAERPEAAAGLVALPAEQRLARGLDEPELRLLGADAPLHRPAEVALLGPGGEALQLHLVGAGLVQPRRESLRGPIETAPARTTVDAVELGGEGPQGGGLAGSEQASPLRSGQHPRPPLRGDFRCERGSRECPGGVGRGSSPHWNCLQPARISRLFYLETRGE